MNLFFPCIGIREKMVLRRDKQVTATTMVIPICSDYFASSFTLYYVSVDVCY